MYNGIVLLAAAVSPR